MSRLAIMKRATLMARSPDPREVAFTRRLDRLTRQIQRLERNTGVTMEMLALAGRFLLTVTPPLPPDAQAALQAKGQQRYEGFVEALGGGSRRGSVF
jgi:hypothetical protein